MVIVQAIDTITRWSRTTLRASMAMSDESKAEARPSYEPPRPPDMLLKLLNHLILW